MLATLGLYMNIDELVNSIPDEKLRDDMTQIIRDWKEDEKDIEWLSQMFTKWHGNVWFGSNKESLDFLNQLKDFRVNAIEGLQGLTLNERLYWFGLFEHWDTGNESEHNRIRQKLHAKA